MKNKLFINHEISIGRLEYDINNLASYGSKFSSKIVVIGIFTVNPINKSYHLKH